VTLVRQQGAVTFTEKVVTLKGTATHRGSGGQLFIALSSGDIVYSSTTAPKRADTYALGAIVGRWHAARRSSQR
jgi:hypothetical protein